MAVRKEYEDNIAIQFTFSEVSNIVDAMFNRLDMMVAREAPENIMELTLQTAKRLNDILREHEFNHYTDEKFAQYQEKES